MARYGFSPPTRIFEAAGAGACIMTDAWAGIEQFFEPDREIFVVKDGNGVVETLGRLNCELRLAAARRARARVLAEHTYLHRAGQVHRTLQGNSQREAAA
jgi:spore maturation protein CgeB